MTDDVQSFYTRVAPAFDVVARHAPGVGRARHAAANALDVAPGETVLDVGCGTGANASALRERVGLDGRILGVDVTEALLRRARDRGVAAVRGDATRLPLRGPVDGVLATFVVGLFDDPGAVVESWLTHLEDGGRLVILEATPSDHPLGRAANPLFSAFVRAGAPGRTDADAARRLERRVSTVEETLRAADGTSLETQTRLGGFLTLLVAER